MDETPHFLDFLEPVEESQFAHLAACDFLAIQTLLLDELPATDLTKADKVFLEQFANLKRLSLRGLHIKSLRNMPVLPQLQQLRLADN